MMAAGEHAADTPTRRGLAAVRRVADERAYLYDVIRTIGSGPDLEAILRGIVHLVTEATACHACFVYFVRDDRLVLRAASSEYEHLEERIELPIGEGLTGWVAKARRSAFIRERALEDPRVRGAYFPELEEERFQSLVSVPIFARAGDVIGVITLHAEAPHEFAPADLEFLEHTASLIAGAVENARLYEDARAWITLLTDLSTISQAIASSTSQEDLLRVVVEGTRRALRAERCEVHLLDAADRLTLGAASPERSDATTLEARKLWISALATDPTVEEARPLAEALWGEELGGIPVFVPLSTGEDPLGIVAILTRVRAQDARRALTAIASHTAVAINRHRLIEGLHETNLVKDFFEGLSRGDEPGEAVWVQASRLGCDLDRAYVAVHVIPWAPPRGTSTRSTTEDRGGATALDWRETAAHLQSRLAPAFSGSLFDQREGSMRGLVPVEGRTVREVGDLVRQALEDAERPLVVPSVAVGISDVCRGASSFRSGFEEAVSAAEVGSLIRGSGGVSTYEDLGPYRYVLTSEEAVRDRYQSHLERLADYDDRRGTRLLETLETYLDRRGNVVATSRALYVHPNTLRQRLARIHQLTELDLEREDWLSLAIAVKVVKLRRMRTTPDEEGRDQDG